MGLYSRWVLPRIVDFACSTRPTRRQRQKVIPLAVGEVLEIGLGSGLNVGLYDADQVTKLWGLEPSPEMRRLASDRVQGVPFEFEFLDLPGDQIPLEPHSVDTVVMTYTLCTIPDPEPALRAMARVLRPGGKLIFCEHGAAPDAEVRRWQERINPLWSRFAGGCNLNREIPATIAAGGFAMTDLDTMYIPGWRPACFNYWGVAVPR